MLGSIPKTSASSLISPPELPSSLKSGALRSAIGLHRFSHQDHRSFGSGHRTAQQEQAPLLVDPDHFQVESRHLLATHAAGHAHSLEDTGGSGTGADRSRGAMLLVSSVRGALAGEVVALHDAGEALALGDSGDVGLGPWLEHLGHLQLLSELELGWIIDLYLNEVASRGHPSLGVVAGLGLAHA